MMIRTILVIAMSLGLALGGGAWLTAVALQKSGDFGGITIDGWTAFPLSGTQEADPYAKARLARDAALALGAAEGVTFYATEDAQGDPLASGCDYTLEGRSPSARLWTIYALDSSKARLAGLPELWPTSLNSEVIAYGPDGQFKITVSSQARPNNWLAVPAARRFTLALNLYDSPVATNKGLVQTNFPKVIRGDCHD